MSVQERSDLVLSFARVLFDNGETTGEVVQAAKELGRNLGLSIELIPGWKDLQLQAGDGSAKLVSATIASPTGIDMDRVSSAMNAVDEIRTNQLSSLAASKTIEIISRAPPSPTWMFTLAAAAGAAALSVIFGVQHPISVLLIVISAGMGALLRRTIAKYSNNPFIQPFCAALIAGLIGSMAVIYNLSSMLRLIAVCPCLVLIPGPHVLNGMIDLVQARVSLAISRLVYAGFIILTIAAGLLLIFALFHVSLPVDAPGRSIPLLIDVAAAGVAAAAYSIFYSTPLRMIGWPIIIGMTAHGIRYEALASGADAVTATFAASLLVGLVMAPIARFRHMPFAAIGFASVVAMIPGLNLLRMVSGFLQLINTSTTNSQLLLATLSDGVTAVAIVLALTFGLIVPKIVIDHYLSRRISL
jgi:uncharacterized membrane protein YjjP (DUF1212 family)